MPRKPAHKHGQRAAHQKRRKKEDDRRSEKSQRQKSCAMSRGNRVRCNINSADRSQASQRNRAARRYADFNPAVQRNRPIAARAPPAKPRAPRSESSHEHSENSIHRIGRMSKNQPQRFAPRNLIDQSGSTGEKETNEQA